MKIIFGLMKKVVVTFGVIYALDLILDTVNIFIPINVATLSVGTILGPFGILGMVIIMLVSK